MDHVSEKTQRRAFVEQVLPDLFHTAPDQFLFYLERDGIKLIHFYWNETGKKLPYNLVEPAYGLSYEIRKPRPRVTVALIGLPQPQAPGEAYFAALCYRPYRVMPFGWLSDTTQVLTLERAFEDDQPEATLLVNWSRRHGREALGPGPRADLESFFQAALAQIED